MDYRIAKDSPQWGFRQSRAKIQFMGGGFGNGKTTALVIKALDVAESYPGANMLLGRATYPKLNDTLRREFFKWCPSEWIRRMPTKDDNTCYMHNGTIVNFRYIQQKGKANEEGETSSNLISANYDFVGIDQCEDPEIAYKDITDMLGRLRGQAAYIGKDESMPLTGPRWLCLTANPTMGWLFKRIIRPYLLWKKTGQRTPDLLVYPETGEPMIDVFEGSTFTNTKNLPPDFLLGLSALKGQQYDRYVMGKWAAYEGLIYSNYDADVHGLSHDDIMDHIVRCVENHVQLQVIEAYDFGLTSPSCYGLFVVDHWGRVILVDGFYKPNFPYDEQTSEIERIRSKYIHLLDFNDAIRADPDIFRRKVIAGKKATGTTLASLLANERVHFKPASNDITAGIAKVTSYVNTHARIEHPVTDKLGAPLLYHAKELDWFETEILGYMWKKNSSGERIDEPIDNNDHAMDMLKYALSYLPDPSEIVTPPEALPPVWMNWHEMEMER